MSQILIDTRQEGLESALVKSRFCPGMIELTENRFDPISIAQTAELRIKFGKEAAISQAGHWVSDRMIYVPGEQPRITRVSPHSINHQNAHELSPMELELMLEGSIPFYNSHSRADEPIDIIPSKKFGSEEGMVYIFNGEKQAEDYGSFLHDAGIKKMRVISAFRDYIDNHQKPYTTNLFFYGIKDSSALACDLWADDADHPVRGIRSMREIISPAIQQPEVSQISNSDYYLPDHHLNQLAQKTRQTNRRFFIAGVIAAPIIIAAGKYLYNHRHKS